MYSLYECILLLLFEFKGCVKFVLWIILVLFVVSVMLFVMCVVFLKLLLFDNKNEL